MHQSAFSLKKGEECFEELFIKLLYLLMPHIHVIVFQIFFTLNLKKY